MANMVDVTKYLLYKATDYDYGVQSYDFSVYKPENFKKLYDKFSNLDGVPGKVYNFLLSKGVSPAGAAAVLGNIQEQVTLKQTQQAQMVVMDYAYGKMIDLKIYNHGQKVTTRHGQVLLHN